MHATDLLQDLAIVLLVAGAVTVIFHRIRQPVVLGYILAGAIIGPHTPPFPLVHDERSIHTLAELGMILLMFGLGLHFSLRQLASVGSTAFIAASIEIVVMSLVGYMVGQLFGWNHMDSLFLGALLSVSSTTIIIKALSDLGLTKHKFAGPVFGILIVEDILAIAILALLSGIAMTGTVAMTLGKLAVFLAVVLVVGLLAVPPLLRFVARFKSDEVLVVMAVGLCFGVSLLAHKMGYSVALGAFLIGAIIAEAREKHDIERLIEPVRDVFSAIFFVAVGMMIDPRMLVDYALPIVVITIIVIVGKVLTCSMGTFVAGHDRGTSLRVGMAVSQIGEFSFIIAQLGVTLKVTSDFLYPIAVMVSAITTLSTPYLIRASDPLVAAFDRKAPRQMVNALDFYSAWVERLSSRRGGHAPVRKLLRRWALQIGLNLLLVIGIMIVAVTAGRYTDERFPSLPSWLGGPRTAVWLIGVLLSLPLLIASVRKLRAMARLMAESAIRLNTPEKTQRARAVMTHAVLFVGTAGMVALVLMVSATLLPPLPGLIALLVVIVGVAAVMWRSFVRAYAMAQISLAETLSPQPEAHSQPPPLPLPRSLEGAILESVTIPPDSPACGKRIGELQLRTKTAATVVGIQRQGVSVVSPGPGELLQPGDEVFLIGVREAIDSAGGMLRGEELR